MLTDQLNPHSDDGGDRFPGTIRGYGGHTKPAGEGKTDAVSQGKAIRARVRDKKSGPYRKIVVNVDEGENEPAAQITKLALACAANNQLLGDLAEIESGHRSVAKNLGQHSLGARLVAQVGEKRRSIKHGGGQSGVVLTLAPRLGAPVVDQAIYRSVGLAQKDGEIGPQ